MHLFDAFMSERQLRARGRPLRAPAHKLNLAARIGVVCALALQLACVLAAGAARTALGFGGGLLVLVLAHVAVYLLESRAASLKPRWRRPGAPQQGL